MAKKNRNIVVTFFESVYGAVSPDKSAQAVESQKAYRTFRAKALSQRSAVERAADAITAFFGSISFAVLHIIWFLVWILINTHRIPGLAAFDPYPFGLLTMIVSLEAIFLSVIVLISQNRESQITELREEVDFQINRSAEQEVTKLLSMVHEIHSHLGLDKKVDKEVLEMKKKLDTDKIAAEIKKEVEER